MLSGITKRKVGKEKNVEVHIDIAHEDYNFTTQPGALKRVILNVFGNALKYTMSGSVVAKLSLHPIVESNDGSTDDRILEFKVVDTGKGISSEYLRTSLFNPFCQEDPLASGTGLGLSIVRSIVTMLGGNIDIKSEVGEGTEVTIRLPLSRLSGSDTPVSTPSSPATESFVGDSISALKAGHEDASVALYGFSGSGQRSILTNYIENWFGFELVSPSSNISTVDICIVDEKERLHLPQYNQRALPTVVLCDNATRAQTASRHNRQSLVEYVSKPIGPYKLAKALRSCLDKGNLSKAGLLPLVAFSNEDSPMESEADTVIPDLGLEHLTLEGEQGEKSLEVRTNGTVTASESQNARMAIHNSSCTSGSVTIKEGRGFPFPPQDKTNDGSEMDEDQSSIKRKATDEAQYRSDLVRRDSRRPPLTSRMTEPVTKTPFPQAHAVAGQQEEAVILPSRPSNQPLSRSEVSEDKGNADNTLYVREVPTPQRASDLIEQKKRPPRLLLVDDNKINLRLLETYMRKRKYEFIDLAENGQFAVQAAEAHEPGYDIIFMGKNASLGVSC